MEMEILALKYTLDILRQSSFPEAVLEQADKYGIASALSNNAPKPIPAAYHVG